MLLCIKESYFFIIRSEGEFVLKSKGIAYLLHTFLGVFGAGRFYVGDIGMGILNLFTFGGFGILWLVDFLLLSGRVDYRNMMFMGTRGSINNNNNSANSTNVNTVNVTIDPNMFKNLQDTQNTAPEVEEVKA